MAKSFGAAELRRALAIVSCVGVVSCTPESVTNRENSAANTRVSQAATDQPATAGAAASVSEPTSDEPAGTPLDPRTPPDPATLIVNVSEPVPEPDPNDGDAEPEDDCGSLTQMAEARLAPADIVWVIDGSGSMKDEQAAVQQNITLFANTIASAGIDHHVVMVAPTDIANSTPLGSDASAYLHVSASVNSHNALSTLLDRYSDYADFLREDGSLHFVVVSDDDSNLAAAEFRSRMEALVGKPFLFHAIASEDINGLGCAGACGIPLLCGASRPGREYYALADATGGEKISICTSDWSLVFGPLQQAVIRSAPLPCDYALPAPPAGSSLDPMRVNVEVVSATAAIETLPNVVDAQACGTEAAWYYDDRTLPTRINMCPSACENISGGGTVQIKLGCETKTISLD